MKSTTPKSDTSAQQIASMSRLTQQAASWLLGANARDVRDNPTIPRAADGSYDASKVVRWTRGQFSPVDLDASELEAVLTVAEMFAGNTEAERRGVVRILESIEQQHGAAGMAAVGVAILDAFKDWIAEFGDSVHYQPGPMHDLYVVALCGECGRYRWGKQWKPGEIPTGYAGLGTTCPRCLRKLN